MVAIGQDGAAAYKFYGGDEDTVVPMDERPSEQAVNRSRPPPDESFWVVFLSDANSAIVTDSYNTSHRPTNRVHDGEVTAVRYTPRTG